MLWRSPLRGDCTAMLGLGSRRRTHYVRFAHCVQTAAASRLTKRAGARRPRPCAARRHRNRPCRVPPAARATRGGVPVEHLYGGCKGAFGQVAARLWSAEKRRACGPARSANQYLTRRGCLNAANEVSVVSSATGPRDRASQGSRSEAQTAPAKRCGLPGRPFAAPAAARIAVAQGQRRMAQGRFHFSRTTRRAARRSPLRCRAALPGRPGATCCRCRRWCRACCFRPASSSRRPCGLR